jgi:hypothetical protein
VISTVVRVLYFTPEIIVVTPRLRDGHGSAWRSVVVAPSHIPASSVDDCEDETHGSEFHEACVEDHADRGRDDLFVEKVGTDHDDSSCDEKQEDGIDDSPPSSTSEV